jgi:protease-4
MIASQCDEIVATGSSDVGSIGVIMEVGDYSELLKKLGVKFIAIHEGEFKDAGAPWRGLTATETAMLKDDIKIVYDDFISSVAKGRKMSEPDVRKLATGWAWPGRKAKDLGLVDSIGNYSDAVARAGKLGKIDGEPRIVNYRDESLGALIQRLTGALDRLGGAATSAPGLLPQRPALR